MSNQTSAGTVSRATLGGLLKDGMERIWTLPSSAMPSRSPETGNFA